MAPPLTTFSSPPATGTPAPPSLDNDSETYDLFNFDVVYLAALVGTSGPEKRQILRDLVSKMKPGALVVVRSAWGLRGLIYPVRSLLPPLLSLHLSPFLYRPRNPPSQKAGFYKSR